MPAGPDDPIVPDEAATLLAPLIGRDAGCAGVLLAVSGGPDSVALLHLAALWRERGGAPPLFAATVDHGLRPESAGEAERVAEWCAERRVPHAVLRWTGRKPATRIHAAAREARYALLAQQAERVGATHIVTAHHRDDLSETVLMRLTRGSGVRGLAAMRKSRPLGGLFLVRPFLDVSKSRLLATLTQAGQDWLRDPSNADPRFGRTRTRRLAAMLAEEGLDAARLAALARRAARADAALDEAARAAHARHLSQEADRRVFGPGLLGEPDEIMLRVLQLELERHGPVRLERLESLAADLSAAARRGHRLTRSLAGAVTALDGLGQVTISAEKERRRGRRALTKADGSS
ncbi:tRNA lysidine(34) synthetase TilS [Alsobacter sp. SYSU M60028]|uniref:tRNA(Ile)-lysidine synthase n=1 Tax=Alsobacter ponti TaxID=2962936 RepID=A0ABT1LIY0_9HYPH|nr:tRNA lysidine(34) synthetase TilS [Alsobacter ponti]MCP8940173.1 tRNA lysidine(34) synthetase TilS [Alsobacter ponti]